MSRSSHRAVQRPGKPFLQTLGFVVVLVLIVAGIALTRLTGSNGVTADVAAVPPLSVGPTTALDTTGTETSDAAPTEAPTRSAVPAGTPRATDRKLDRMLDRKVSTRRAELAARLDDAAELAREVRRRRVAQQSAPFDVRVGTFNVLGSQHTAPGGERRNFPPASVRSPAQAAYINDHGLEIVGMQELQDDQLNAISSRTGLSAYPGYDWGAKETDNSILYDADRFEMVSGDVFTIPFMGRPRPQPILRLRVRATGREFYVVNTHPSAGHYGKYAAERHHGQDVLIGVLANLRATGLPILLTGDMNDRETFYDRVVCRGGLVSASGGSGCSSRPPQMWAVDWVVGSPAVSFSDYSSDPGPGDRRLTDHYVVHATAHVG